MTTSNNDRPFDDYRYAAFFSYATADDDAWNQWVSCFKDELQFSLPTRLRGIRLPGIHLSGDAPLVSGLLSEQLQANVRDAFSMFLFVHDNYLDSEWCLKELTYFKSLFGDEAFRDRLYIIAMSETDVQKLSARDDWQLLFPFADQVWVPFFQAAEPEQPIPIYSGDDNLAAGKRRVVSNAFWTSFVRIREELAKKIRDAVAAGKLRAVAAPPEDPENVRIYIESNERQESYWAPLAQQVTVSWDQVIANFNIEPCLYVRPTGLPMNDIDNRPFLDDADGVMLLWDKKTPDSLVAQITKVENKLRGASAAPGVIAFIKEPGGQPPPPNRVLNWPVLKFEADASGTLRIVPEDVMALGVFLTKVLERKRQRVLASAPATAGGA